MKNCRGPDGSLSRVCQLVTPVLMVYGLGIVALSKRQEVEEEVAEPRMLIFSLGVTRMERIRVKDMRNSWG